MPRGGRRGRFWSRFHRDEDGVPPPPPPPNVDHLRWSFSPVRRGRRNLRPWLLDSSGSGSDRSPPSRWIPAAGGHQQDGGYYYDEDNRDNHHSGEICFICGDLVGNHPEAPSVHLCDNGDYAYVGGGGMNRGSAGHGGYGRRMRRDHDPPGMYQSYQEGPVYGAAGGRSEKHMEEPGLDWIVDRLQNSQLSMETMNQNMKDLCFKLKVTSQIHKGSTEENEGEEDGFTDNLVTELQAGLQDQYQRFLDHVRLQIMEKSVSLEAEGKRIKQEKQNLVARLSEIEERQRALDTQEREVTEMRRKVEGDRAKFVKDSDTEKTEIRRQWQKLKDEVARMEEMHKLQQNRVKLDVGGVTFTTSTSTLTRDQDSMLAAMFSGRHELKYEEDGTIFIDRDGTHFRYILNFLRDGATEGSLPDSQQSLKELLNEAVYYQIAGLVESIEERLQ